MNTKQSQAPLPVFINKQGGSAETVMEALASAADITVHALPAEELKQAIQEAVDKGTPRIVVSGGDGTLAMAAGLLVDCDTEMAIIPGGTLNHFAKRLNIPLEIEEALTLAKTGQAQHTPFALVNERLFLNTSSVGAYVSFVQTREKLENTWPYYVASVFSAVRRLVNFRRVSVRINDSHLKTPLVFISVGERELQLPEMGQHKINGRDGLHLIALRCRNSWTALMIAIKAMFLGANPLARTQDLENKLLETIEVDVRSHNKQLTIALDGELVKLNAPLMYQFRNQGLKVVMPS